MKTLRYGLIVLVVGLCLGAVLAQDNTLPENRCTQDDYQWVSEQMDIFSGNFRDIATYDPIETAYDVRTLMNSMQMYCSGVFTNETHPNGIVGPIAFDGTLYEVTFVTYFGPDDLYDLGGVAGFVTVSGDCGLHSASTDRAGKPDTALWEFGEGCVGFVEITIDLWELSIVKIR